MYNKINNKLQRSNGSICDSKEKLVNPLARVEFLSVENQRRVYSDFQYVPKRKTPVPGAQEDLHFEDCLLNMQECKDIATKRRDTFWAFNSSTKGCSLVFDILHHRTFYPLQCFSRDSVTLQSYPGKFYRQYCTVDSCRHMGPCHETCSVVNLHNCSK